ncbi:hypothetical protein [Gordonia terrae]|uniref:Uncharacterized protein n=2 Tax=Gordonia terrae TaxID=2055 RepID=A0AAD0K9H6_9ACTN|nr:hypothetical protein [Gordonia terrae]VTR08845.1 Uncharacterised protein [Clostridioides difficile]ANY21589.1 hypothetical protein BCM27_01005 [Gordonia terrae]AWO82317.1 hypothetical protein DLJ61_01010 [Gordonia terrae]VTS17276.1 Uncharacterised protein [Gordonia terrae]GAB44617.1 hypothetical protein GOTRE_069_01050 [Gordonia terrae NBRC 100016]
MTELIAMLTHNDKTIDNAREIFAQAIDAPTKHWGFKDTGLSASDQALLAQDMKNAGKTVHFESLKEEESDCLTAAQFAVDNGLDFLIGMAFHTSVADLLSKSGVGYLPTCGGRSGIPRMLHGSIEDIVGDAKRIRPQVDGVALSLYRWTDGEPGALGKAFVEDVEGPVVVTGSINSTARMDEIARLSPWGITVGSALFDDVFGAGTFGAGLEYMRDYLDHA